MGYALNLCKFHIYHVPYNHNATEEGMEMTQNRIRIVDVADTLGLSSIASNESNPSLTTIHPEANLRQHRIILSADTASEVRQMPSQKCR